MNNSTTIFLIRHGETLWNTQRRLQGHKDSSLTEKGLQQARNNGLALRALCGHANRIISSPLGRCRQTSAEVARAMHIDPRRVEYDDRVKELSFGKWEGQKITDIERVDGVLWRARKSNRWDIEAPGGESYSMVAGRLQDWLNEVEGQTLILVSHGCAGRILRGIYANLTPRAIYSLEEPHDAIYLLERSNVTRVV